MGELGDDVEAALKAWFDREVDRAWQLYQSGDHARALVPEGASREERLEIQRRTLRGDAENSLGLLQADYQQGDYLSGEVRVPEVLASSTATFDRRDRRFTLLAKRIMEALGELHEAKSRWADGDEGYSPTIPPAITPSEAAPTPAVAHDDRDAPTLGEVAERYLDHRRKERRSSLKMIAALRGQVQLLTEEVGAGTKVTAVTPRQAGEIFDAFRSLPGSHRKNPALDGLTLVAAARKARELGLPAMNPKTINNHMTTYRGIFKQAIDSGWLTANPFKGKHISVAEEPESDRGFTDEELGRILSSPVFMGCERPHRPFQPGTFLLNERRFWVPMVALFSGSRIAEISQLSRADLEESEGVWTISITRQGEKRTKTAQSVRKVPIHDELLRLGFIEYSKSRPRHGGAGSLFDIPSPRNENWGQKMGNWWREKFLPSVFSEGKRFGTGLHSFRHRIETEMRAADVRQDVGDRLMGHKTGTVASRYGAYKPVAAREAIMRLRFPDAVKSIPPRY